MFHYEFQKIGIDVPMGRTSGKIKLVCPKCRERKGGSTRDKDLSVSIDQGLYKCHSSKCGWSGRVSKEKYERPQWNNRTLLPDRVVSYFEKRGISQKTLQEFRITTSDRGGVQFNYFRGEELINIKTRWQKEGKKYFKQHSGAEHILYNLNSLQGKEKCIIVEGEMDVLTWHECGVSSSYGIVSVDQGAFQPGQNPGAKLQCIETCAIELDQIKQFYICTDKDAPGLALQQELIRRFGAHRCYVINLPDGIKDANEVVDRTGGSDYPRETNIATLRHYLDIAEPVPVPGIHTLNEEESKKLDNFFDNGREEAKTTHLSNLDNIYRFLPGDMTCITGIPGHGKSQFVRQLMILKSHFDGWKWACYVPEDFPFDYFAEDIIKCFIGKNVDKNYSNRMTKEEFEQGKQFVREHFFCIYPEANEKGEVPLPDNNWINERIRFLRLKFGVNAYVKDPWNKIYHNFHGREDQYLMAEFSKEKFFAMQFDASLYTAHPKTLVKNKDGSYPMPTPYDLSGGAMWYNQFDNHLSVFRPNAWENSRDKIVAIHSTKIKKQRIVAQPGDTEFWFDAGSARYMDAITDAHPMTSNAAYPEKVAIEEIETDDFPDWDELVNAS